jgi:uncharacterized protein (DUF736 family)
MSQNFIEQFRQDCAALRRRKHIWAPDDIVVVRNRDADEAGDYRVMKHCEAVGNSQWEITDIDPADLD